MQTQAPEGVLITAPVTQGEIQKAKSEFLGNDPERVQELLTEYPEIQDATGYTFAENNLTKIKSDLKKIDGLFGGLVKRAKGLYDESKSVRDTLSSPYKNLKTLIEGRLNQYDIRIKREETERKEAERRKRDEEIAANAVAKARREEQEQSMDTETAAMVAQAPEAVPQPKPAPAPEPPKQYVPPVTTQSRVTLYSAQGEGFVEGGPVFTPNDLRKLVVGIAEGKIPVDAIKANEVWLNQVARRIGKEGELYPGVMVVGITSRRDKPQRSA